MHDRDNKMNGGKRSRGWRETRKQVCRDFRGGEGWRKTMEKEGSEELVIESLGAQSVSGLFSRRPWRGDLSGATSFLSWALQKRAAARGEGVTRSLARDGWRREAGSASTRYIIIHLLLYRKLPASEPQTQQDTFSIQPKAAWLSDTDRKPGQRGNIPKLL